MGTGDWNDGMNQVGAEGQGESVWLGWFAYANLVSFIPVCERMGDQEQAGVYRQQAERLRESLEENAWDGSWYRRAYYDDGTPLGSAQNKECEIDSIAQSWAALSGAGDRDRVLQAMRSVEDRLVRADDRVILLFSPPFDRTNREPGYIKGYPPGIRENGGQYTHAALWTVWAFAKLGQGDLAGSLFHLLNPVHHSDGPDKLERYRVEPYVVAADVYSTAPHTGRGGWTWYTGSAGWMYRLGLEAILGLKRKDGALHLDPCVPKGWPGFEITYQYGKARFNIAVQNPDGRNSGIRSVTVDGEEEPDKRISLLDDGQEHTVEVVIG
jgi:cellobiose phosphorylase